MDAHQIIGKGNLVRLDENIKSIINKWDSEYIVQVVFNYYCREMKLYLIMEMIKMTVKNNKQININTSESIYEEIEVKNNGNIFCGSADNPIIMQLLYVNYWLTIRSAKWISLNPLARRNRPLWRRQYFRKTSLDKINNMLYYLGCCGAGINSNKIIL